MTSDPARTIEFRLPDPSYETATWEHNEHTPGSMAPLQRSVAATRNARPEEGGLPGTINVNGYAYTRAGEADPVAADMPDGPDELAGWRDVWLPRIEATSRAIETFDPASVARGGWRETLQEQQRDFWRTFFGLHRHTVGPANAASTAFIERYASVFGDERRRDAMALLQGFTNSSGERSAALWDLSRIVREDADLRRQIEHSDIPEGGSDAVERFRRGLDDLLERFGDTSQMRLEDIPLWREDPSLALSLVLRYGEQDDDGDPRRAQARQAERRQALEQELRERTATDGVDELLSLLPIAQLHLATIEDHNLLGDQRMFAASRSRWLRVGQHLRERGAIAEPDDVFYHHLDELIDALEGGKAVDAAAIAERRAQQAEWRAVTPPAFLGKPPGDGGAPATLAIRGAAASPGVHRGRARVVASLDQARALERGDVLIAAATGPEWTPYFAVIGAVVTDSGGLLTHGAIVAREFGIPAVVGTGVATARIPDGATVTVDGDAGTVTVEP